MASSEDFGPTCRYKNGESYVCNTPEELAQYDKDGWKDSPSDVIDLDSADFKVVSDAPAKRKKSKK